jgi:hypothetical protein
MAADKLAWSWSQLSDEEASILARALMAYKDQQKEWIFMGDGLNAPTLANEWRANEAVADRLLRSLMPNVESRVRSKANK